MKFKKVAPCVFVYDNAFDKCESLIKRSLQNDQLWKSAGIDEGKINSEVRNCRLMPINTSLTGHIDDILLAKCLFDYGDHYGKETHSTIIDMEPPQLLHYKTSKEFYNPHIDDGPGVPRIFSSVLYLNDVEKGGETRFTNFNVSVKPKAGRLLMFPANFAYEHEALAPQSGEKFAVVTWFTPMDRFLP